MEKLKKKYMFLIVMAIIGIVMGVIFANVLSTEDERVVYSKISEYFNNLKNDTPINYLANLFATIKNNYIYLIVIWILGLSIIGLLFNNFIVFLKSFILGFSIGSIINIYLYSGLVLSFFYVFPCMIINLIILIIMTYYANDFSFKLFEVLFKKKEYKFPPLIKRYTKILGIFLIFLFISGLFETFITPLILKLFSFLIN